MANKLPAFILKGINLYAEGNNRIGHCQSITVPVMTKMTEEFRNAGMVKPREVHMGYEATTCQFTEPELDPDALSLFGVARGKNKRIIAYGYLESEDGTETAARFEMTCEVKQVDMQSWQPGEKQETNFDIAVHEGRLVIGDREVYRFDDFDYWIDGERQQPGRRDALRIG